MTRRIVTRREKRKARRWVAHVWKDARETRLERKRRRRRVFIIDPAFLRNVPRTEVRYRAFTRA